VICGKVRLRFGPKNRIMACEMNQFFGSLVLIYFPVCFSTSARPYRRVTCRFSPVACLIQDIVRIAADIVFGKVARSLPPQRIYHGKRNPKSLSVSRASWPKPLKSIVRSRRLSCLPTNRLKTSSTPSSFAIGKCFAIT